MHVILNSAFTPAVIGAISHFTVDRFELDRNNNTVPGGNGAEFDVLNINDAVIEYIDTVFPLKHLRGYFYQVSPTLAWSDIAIGGIWM